MITMRRILSVVLVLMIAAPVPACLFSTREDEVQPPGQSGCPVVSLNDPLQVFGALRQSLNVCQDDANYERAISTDFIFSPTLQDSLDQNFIGTGVYDNWDKPREMDTLGLMLADAKTIRAEFSPSVEINKNTFVRYRVGYELDIVNTASPADTARYRGIAFFDVRNESGNWRLTFWDESETVDGFSTWGFLRGVLGLRLTP